LAKRKTSTAPAGRWRSRITGQGTEAPDQLIANPDNWRLHPAFQQAALTEALDRVGWIQQVIVNKRTGNVVDGHLRVELALQNNEPTIPVVYVDLTPDEEKIALATLDPLSALADQDSEKLAELTALVNREDSPTLIEMLEDLVGDIGDGYDAGEGEDGANNVPPVEKTPITVPGQVWRLGRHRVICGDCTDPSQVAKLCDGEAMDSMVTDPPYGIDYDDKNEHLSASGRANTVDRPIANDRKFKPGEFEAWATKWLAAARTVLADTNTFYVFISGRNAAPLSNAIEAAGGYAPVDLVWVKNTHVLSRQDYSPKHESIRYGWFGRHRFYGDFSHTVIDDDVDVDQLDHQPLVEYAKQLRAMLKEDVIRHPRPNVSDLHPTMKPVELLAKLIRDGSPDDGRVLDLFGGSGSTLMACENEGRAAYLAEIEPVYVDVIVRRWQQYTGETAVDDATGELFPS
jgi:DNA modification methylase